MRTGAVWEQYDPFTGEGARSHPFTGWTALVALGLSLLSSLSLSLPWFVADRMLLVGRLAAVMAEKY